MPRTLDDHELQQLIGDAHHLVERAIEHERRFVALVNLVERQTGAAPETPASDGDRKRLDGLLPQIRRLCVDAREQRQFAERYLERLTRDPAVTASNDTRGRVLIVEDHEDTRELLTVALRGAGLETIAAGNGLEGLVAAHFLRPSVILMDVDMPVLDGIEATRLLKAGAATRDAHVIAHTAKPEFFHGPMTRLFDRVLTKPAAPGDLVASVASFLDGTAS